MKNKLITTLLRSLLCVIGIYLLFIPIFYFYNSSNSPNQSCAEASLGIRKCYSFCFNCISRGVPQPRKQY